jgi:hypothetical protein
MLAFKAGASAKSRRVLAGEAGSDNVGKRGCKAANVSVDFNVRPSVTEHLLRYGIDLAERNCYKATCALEA